MSPSVRRVKLKLKKMIWPFCEGHMWAAVCATGPFLLILLMTLQHFAYTTGARVTFN